MAEAPVEAANLKANPLNLRIIRKRSGFSMRSLALAAGVNAATIHRLEEGTHAGRPDTLRRIAAALDVPITAITDSNSPRDVA